MIEPRRPWAGRAVAGFAILLAIAWLMPNHYAPWTAFHSDWLAGFALAVAAAGSILTGGTSQKVSVLALAVVAIAAVPVLQFASGQIYFGGDALIASLYLAGLAFAIQVGSAAQRALPRAVEPLAWAFMLVAIASSALACVQWLGLGGMGLLMMEMAPGARPYANFAQPNQLATFLVMGGVCALLLRQWRRFGAVTLGCVLLPLLAGLALTQSRAGAVELAAVLIFCAALRKRANLRFTLSAIAVTALVFAAMALCMGQVSELLLLAPSARDAAAQAHAGTRPLHWETVIDAIARQPWFGYGWNQVSVAIAGVASDHPASGELTEHSHNLVLDLLAWNGVPLGLAILVGIGVTFWRHARGGVDATEALLLAAVGVPFIHSLFEFPLEYAYFLFPVGFMVGVLEQRRAGWGDVSLPVWAVAPMAVACVAMLTLVGVEYLQLEENQRSLRFETARIGSKQSHTGAPDEVLLTQIGAFLRFARTEAAPGMSAGQLEAMRKVAVRYGYPPVLFRYAIASGLNHEPAEARTALKRICKQHPQSMCAEAKANWSSLQNGSFPQLQAISFPD